MKKPKISNFHFHIKVCDAPDNLVHIIHRQPVDDIIQDLS